MRLTFPLYFHQFMLINVNMVSTQLFVITIYMKHMVVTMLVPQLDFFVLKLCVNLHVLWAVINLFFFLQFTNLVTLVIFALVKLFVAVLAVNLQVPRSVVILLNHLLREKLFVLVMLVWPKNLTLPITV